MTIKSMNHVLGNVPEKQIRDFLEDSINLPNPIDYPDHVAGFEHWLNRWRKVFSYRVEEVTFLEGESGPEAVRTWAISQIPREHLAIFAPLLRTTLRRLWDEQDSRQREWYCFRLRDAREQMVGHLRGWYTERNWGTPKTLQNLLDIQEAPKLDFFEAAIYWAQLHPQLMLRCIRPACESEYFIRDQKGQKYCSDRCADLARSKAKLNWWHNNPNSPKNKKAKPNIL